MTKPAPLSREEKSWVLYDAANSAFVLVMITAIMPIYFLDVATHGEANAVATSNWAFANSTASLILALLAPVLGTMADYKDRKKPFFLFFLATGLIFTVALTLPAEGQWLLLLLLWIPLHEQPGLGTILNAVVIGRSNIVGKPMASLLLARNATVTITHSRTKDLPDVVRRLAALGFRTGLWTESGVDKIAFTGSTDPAKIHGCPVVETACGRTKA